MSLALSQPFQCQRFICDPFVHTEHIIWGFWFIAEWMDRSFICWAGNFDGPNAEINFVLQLLGIWFITEWQALGSPSNIRFVELGPGRGTLANDIVQTFQHFRQKIFGKTQITFHFIEVSESLSKIQCETLCVSGSKKENQTDECFQEGQSKVGGFPMYWHRDIESIPDNTFTFFLAHEFFDALPIHKFVRTDQGWREVYVDVQSENDDKLHFIELPEVTLATRLIKVSDGLFKYIQYMTMHKNWNSMF